jgi:hypothetical protein
MKIFILIIQLIIFVSCATNKAKESEQNALANAEKEDKIVGSSLPPWVEESGVRDGRLYEVGYAEFSLDKSEYYIKKAAEMDAEVKLLSDAPTDLRVITQNSLTGVGLDSSEYSQIQTSLKEVIGVTSLKSHRKTCRKIIRHLEDSSKPMRACWAESSVSMSDVRRAYQLTLQKKYGVGVANKFDDLMKSELDKINDNNRFDEKSKNGE